jgi:hypothetical protein
MTYKFQLLVLKGMDIETEAFAKLTKKNPRHMERRELYHCFQKVQTESKSLGIISKSTLWYQKGKSGSRQKNQIYIAVFQNQGEQKEDNIMSTGVAKANRCWSYFQE